jgi:hypothetical protein
MLSVAAQDDGVTRTGGASQVSAGPGSAAAIAAAAEARVDRASARIQAAAALAHSESDDGATAQSPVAAAIADPEQGATAQGALAMAVASTGDGASAPASGGGGRAPRTRSRKIRNRGQRERVAKLPSTGSGITTPRTVNSLLAAAAVLAAGGAVALRERGAPNEVTVTPACG